VWDRLARLWKKGVDTAQKVYIIGGNEAVNFSRFLVPLWREGLFDVWSRGFTAGTTI
jgi:hypothetical protein